MLRTKRDNLGRRTDRVKKREIDEIFRLKTQGLTIAEIAKRLNRKMQTVKRHFEARQQLDKDNRLPEKGSIRQKEARQIEHWKRLGRVAEELQIGLEFNRGMEGDVINSRFGGTVWGHWHSDPRKTPNVTFSAQKNKLWECFLEHMNAEYESFGDEFRLYQDVASRLVKEDLETNFVDLHPVSSCQETENLRRKLWLVIERAMFKGSCDICRD